MRINWDTPVDELMHSDNIAYVDLDEGELMHYKYVYKKKVNGKWRYYYDIGEASYVDGNTGRKPSNLRGYTKFQDWLGKDEQDRASRASSAYEQADKNSRNRSYSSASEMKATFKKVSNLGQAAIKANEAYMKTPLGKIDKLKSSFKKAKTVVGNWLTKLGNALKK